MSNQSNIFGKPLVWESVFTNVFRNIFEMNRSAYSVLGFEPGLVLDFDDDYYRIGDFQRPFSNAITHSAASNATMVDSDGLLKWRPHNLLRYSEDFTNAVWSFGAGVTVTEINDGEFQIDYTDADQEVVQNVFSSDSIQYTGAAEVRGTTGETIRMSAKAGGGTLVTLSNEWQWLGETTSRTGASRLTFDTFGGATARTIYVRYPHLYRSDLGGMVNNPDTGNSYVPTTTTARYLPRRGHHVYNGSAWVNEGLLVESEARTNLLTYSAALPSNPEYNASNATVTLMPDEVDPAGQTGTVYRVQMAASSSTFVALASTTSCNHISAYVKRYSGASDFGLFVHGASTAGSSVRFTATDRWERYSVTASTSATGNAGINNTDDTYAVDVLVCFVQIENNVATLSLIHI